MWEKLRIRYCSIIVGQLATCSCHVLTCLFSLDSFVVILFPLPSRIGTGNTGLMFTYLLSQKCWKTGRTLSILVSSLCLLALTGWMQTKHISLASLWELESLWELLRKVAVVCPLVAWEEKLRSNWCFCNLCGPREVNSAVQLPLQQFCIYFLHFKILSKEHEELSF